MFSQRAVDKLKSRKTKPISFCWVRAALPARGRRPAAPWQRVCVQLDVWCVA